MQFTFTSEQHQFREMVQRFLKEKSPPTEVRRLMETDHGYDEKIWEQLSSELGLQSLSVPEQYGGAGFGFVELGIVMEEMGRSLLCAPYFSSTVLATTAILNAGDETQKQFLLPGLAGGGTRAALAITEPNGQWLASGTQMIAEAKGSGYVLTGEKSFVIDGHTADMIVVVARMKGTTGSEGISFFTVDGNSAGLEKKLLETMDPTRKLAHLTFRQVEAHLLGEEAKGNEAYLKTQDQAVIALANEMVGGAQCLLDSAIEYSKIRMQFGRTIGSFQAIKHKCADMLLELELAKSAAYYAAAALDDEGANIPALASMAKSAAGDAYMHIAAETIQIHGGIGFTWDQDTHLWFKRAKSSEVFFGDPAYHRERMVQHWGEGL
jgi:alkylation response protein AidB-like acyl-CoA dehydrogenase